MEIDEKQKMIAETVLAKAHLINLTRGEIKFIEYQLGMTGAFYTGLFELFWKADRFNSDRLMLAFPEEIEAAWKFSNEPDWWENISKKVGI